MENIVWIWLLAAVVFLILELLTPTLVFACFVVAAIGSGIYSFISPDGYYWQIGIFVLIAVILLPLTRKAAKKITKPSPQASNIDALIGKVVPVTQKIDADLGGQVRIEGEFWRAEAKEEIAEGDKVKVISVSGTKVHVKRISHEQKG